MRYARYSKDYCPAISWRTLSAYWRALSQFTAKGSPDLNFSAFGRISAMDVTTLPSPEYFDLPHSGRLGYRHYKSESDVHVVLVHGAGCFGDQLHAIARKIARSGAANAYTLDMRGHGLSDGPRGHAVKEPRQIVDDVSRFVEFLKAIHPHDKIVVAGHSAGGGVTLAVSRGPAARYISGYIFFAPFLGLGSPTIRPYFGGWVAVREIQLRFLAFANLFNVKRFNNRTVIDFNMDACLHDPRFVKSWSFNTMLAFGPGRWLAKAQPIASDVPVLLIAGEKDECFVQPGYAEAFQIIAPHVQIPDVGRHGHWDVLVAPEALNAVQGWMSRHFPQNSTFAKKGESKNEVAA